MLPAVSGEFRLAADPELRFSPSGMAIGNVRLVASSRKKEGDEWIDDKVCWIDGTCFREMAENVAEHLRKGDTVVVTGKIQTESWETKEGDKRSKIAMVIDSIGKNERWNSGPKAERTSSSASGGSTEPYTPDPWATAPSSDEPPF